MISIFDGHSDMWEDVDEKRNRGLTQIIASGHHPGWQKGKISGGFYPIWINPDETITHKEQALRIISNMRRELSECTGIAKVVTSFSELKQCEKDGLHAIFLGAEALSFLEEDPDFLDELYRIGFREASLTWNEKNFLAAGAGQNADCGLTKTGADCIKKMDELGMLVDLAHTNQKTFWDILEISQKPCVITHGSCSRFYSHPRNYTDDQLRAVRDKNGVIGISSVPMFLAPDIKDATINMMLRHIDYAVTLIGEDHVALGFDLVDFLDDKNTDPTISADTIGLESISKAQDLVKGMYRLGYSENTVKKICHENFYRVIKEVIG